MSKIPSKNKPEAASPAPAVAVATPADAPAADATAADAPAAPAEPASKYPKVARIVAVNNDMLHLHTNVWFTQDSKKVTLDDFIRAQLDAGKLAIAED